MPALHITDRDLHYLMTVHPVELASCMTYADDIRMDAQRKNTTIIMDSASGDPFELLRNAITDLRLGIADSDPHGLSGHAGQQSSDDWGNPANDRGHHRLLVE